jgi:hypothetical protein
MKTPARIVEGTTSAAVSVPATATFARMIRQRSIGFVRM